MQGCSSIMQTHVLLLQAKQSIAEMDMVGDLWRPYRSLGSYYMWRIPTNNQQKSPRKKGVSTAAATTTDVTPAI